MVETLGTERSDEAQKAAEDYPQIASDAVLDDDGDLTPETRERIEQVHSLEELHQIISIIFDVMCGDSGKDIFFSMTYPNVLLVYGTNLRKAGFRLVEIIKTGAKCKITTIADYFASAVSPKEIEFAKRSKNEIVDNLVAEINALILEKQREYGDEHHGVVAVVIYGSYAKMNFTLSSDLDIHVVTETADEGFIRKDVLYETTEPSDSGTRITFVAAEDERFINYRDDFRRCLASRVNLIIDRTIESTMAISNPPYIMSWMEEEESALPEGYIVCSPYPETKARVEQILSSSRG